MPLAGFPMSVEHRSGLVRNKRDATIAVILTAIIAASSLRTTLQPMRLTGPWLFEPIYGLPHLGRLSIGLSLFFWGFVLWILFWFYRAARGKYEQLLLASFVTGFVFSTIERFMPLQIAANMQYISTAAALVSLVAAITILFTLPTKTTMPQ
jgi:uncharacterized BrkB/YihY/UPF0761 family membrane protein